MVISENTPATVASPTKSLYRSSLGQCVMSVNVCVADRCLHKLNSRGDPGILVVAGISDASTSIFMKGQGAFGRRAAL